MFEREIEALRAMYAQASFQNQELMKKIERLIVALEKNTQAQEKTKE